MTHLRNQPPGLDPRDRSGIGRPAPGAGKEDKMLQIVLHVRICGLIFFKDLADAGIEDHLIPFLAFFLADNEPFAKGVLFVTNSEANRILELR